MWEKKHVPSEGSTQKAKTFYEYLPYCIVLEVVVALILTAVLVVLIIGPDSATTDGSIANNQSENTEEHLDIPTVDAGMGENIVVEPAPPVEPTLPQAINLQPLVNSWATSTGGEKGIIIYDLDRSEVIGEYNADEVFETASLYKLFVVYEGYRLVDGGEWDGMEVIDYRGYTIQQCLDLAIRESDSTCAEQLRQKMGRDNLDESIRSRYGIDVITSALVASPREIMEMLKVYYLHREVRDAGLVEQMKDSLLNQPVTIYDWRQGLPSGFSDAVVVYNKVGWNYELNDAEDENSGGHWTIYNDAAILDFTERGRHFIVVVMTSEVPFWKIRQFGTAIEQSIVSI